MWGTDSLALRAPWGENVGNGSAVFSLQEMDNATALVLPWEDVTARNATTAPRRVLSPTARVVITTSYVLGVLGNLAALYILHKERKTRYKNKRHTLMLRCLAGNDLVGLLGMLVQMLIRPTSCRLTCVFRVVWRGFGVSSGCVALVMAVERYLALTHPFLYQKRITYHALLKAILSCWAGVLVLSCMPFLGFGLYFDAEASRCRRYREAVDPTDVAYAYVFFTFGLLLALSISWANLAVTRYLCHTSSSGNEENVGRRICRQTSRSSNNHSVRMKMECLTAATADEVAFARLMVALSVTFLLCWLPNMLTIPLAQFAPTGAFSAQFFEIADVLMAIHFTLDPYVYVLLHHYFPCLRITFDAVQRHCCWRSRKPDILEETSCI